MPNLYEIIVPAFLPGGGYALPGLLTVSLSDVADISPGFLSSSAARQFQVSCGLTAGGWAHQGNLAGTQARIQDWPPGRRPEAESRQGCRVSAGPPDEAGVERTAQRQVPSAMPGVQGDGRNVPLPVHTQRTEE